MRLWSVQPLFVYEELKRTGVFRCNPSLSSNLNDDYNFIEGYTWLITEMEKKIGSRPNGVITPIWAWHTRNWVHKKPDLRENSYCKKGEVCVLLELEKKDSEVVLSDYDNWHFILNNWYLGNSLSEEEWEKESLWFDSLSFDTQERVKKKSWKKIFDLHPFENDWCWQGKYIQATFWELKSEEIKSYQIFRGR